MSSSKRLRLMMGGQSPADHYLPLPGDSLLERIKLLHHRRSEPGRIGACATDECFHAGDCPSVPVAVCAHCFSLVARFYEDGEQAWPSEVLWPCPTISAII